MFVEVHTMKMVLENGGTLSSMSVTYQKYKHG